MPPKKVNLYATSKSRGSFRFHLWVEAVPPTNGYNAMALDHIPATFKSLTRVSIAEDMVTSVIPAAVKNVVASGSGGDGGGGGVIMDGGPKTTLELFIIILISTSQ
jgi:hypothetical protein